MPAGSPRKEADQSTGEEHSLEVGVDRDAKTGAFLKGKKGGPGRSKGSRNKLGEAFLNDMYADWETNGAEVIAKVRDEKPDAYLKVVASILPKELNLNVNEFEDSTNEELIAQLRSLDAIVRPFLADEGIQPDSVGAETKSRH